ncbi:MAG: SdrD B-like domain-containing protein, partial [Paracoccaceae bacterium]
VIEPVATWNADNGVYTVQAEDMDLNNFQVVSGDKAEGGKLVKISGNDGRLSTDFGGESGTYNLTLRAQDETDGVSRIDIYVGGEFQQTILLDQQSNGRGSNNSGFTDFDVEGLEIENGDQIEIRAWKNGGEYVRIDQLSFEPVEQQQEPDGLVCLDFEGLAAGTVIGNQFDGVTISAQRDGEGGSNSSSPNDAMIFDGANPTGGDTDLTASGDNVLIISEDNDSNDPDDNRDGGTIWFKFDLPATISSINVLDAEEGGVIRLLNENGQLIQEITIPSGLDGGIQTINIGVDGVAQIDLTLNGSGAIDDLKYVPGEEPELASVAGTVFMDNNDNSVQDAGDMNLEGVEVILFQAGVGEIARTTTDANGNYLFEDVTPGAGFRVQFDNVDGKEFVDVNVGNDDTIDSDAIVNPNGASTERFDLAPGEDKTDLDAGVEQIDTGDASLAGVVFMDNNDNDVEDAGDMRLEGVEVTLLDGNGNVAGTATTDANGAYEFLGLDAGDYTVQFPTDVNGKVLVGQDVGNDDTIDSDADQGSGLSQTVSLSIGQRIEDIDAGVEDPGTAEIAGRVFCDENDDSLDNNEDGVAGVTVRLLNADGSDTGLSTETGPDGSYEFTGLAAGDYIVDFDENDSDVGGKVLVDQDVDGNANDTDDSDASQADGQTGVITVGIGERSEDNDAGVEDPGTASVGDTVFFDNNSDGIFNAGDLGADGVEVKLFEDQDGDGTAETQISTQFTSNGGQYLFNNLNAGTYAVMFGTLAGFGFTTEGLAAADAVNDDSDASLLDGMTDEFILSIGEAERDVDAGLVALNGDPEPEPDAVTVCADDVASVMVLANDSDPENDALSIVAIDGQAIDPNGGQITTANGTIVTLVVDPFSGAVSLAVNGEVAYAGLDIDETANEAISYTVDDGNGNTATTDLTVTFKGDANSYDSMIESFPENGTYQLISGIEAQPFQDFGFALKVDGTGDVRFDGVIFENAYCLSFLDPAAVGTSFDNAPVNPGDLLSGSDISAFDATQISAANGEMAADNLDLVSWIVAQNFEGNGTFSGWEVQFAIWELTDNVEGDDFNGLLPNFDGADVDSIVAMAIANGEGFEFGTSGQVGAIIDPNPASPTNSQPFIIGYEFEDFDCLCPEDNGGIFG